MEKVQLSAEAKVRFQEGISLVFSNWYTLRLAVENEWGGRNSREKEMKLASDVFAWFTQTKDELCAYDLEDQFDDAMLNSFNTEEDFDSIKGVAGKLMSMYKECLGGSYDSINKLRDEASQPKPVRHITEMEDDDEDDDDDEEDDGVDMMVDAPEIVSNQASAQAAKVEPSLPTATEAEDGWTTVSSKKNRGRTRRN